MSIQTEAMRDGAEKQIVVYTHRDTGLFHAGEMVNHPTPSGCERWLPTYTDKRGWHTTEQAIEEFKKIVK